ncbi:MAG: uncharacterized protein JWO13_3437 [Acidobacteriales bacterium]|nr:uncharacterized protein [Terriglobales bacterium]
MAERSNPLLQNSARRDCALWAGILAGPVAFALDEVVSYAMTQHSCSTGHVIILHLMGLFALCLIAVGATQAWTVFAKLPEQADQEAGGVLDRSRFMAISGLVLCVGFSILVIAQAIPRFLLSPCD